MRRRTRRLILLLSALALSGPPASAAGQGGQQPNIVFILADDLGWRDITPFGSDFYETPNLERLARQGMRFSDAYAASTVCSPTRASILTGQYPARLRQTDWIRGRSDRPDQMLRQVVDLDSLPLHHVTLAEALKGAGYATAHVGKWHLGGRGFLPEDQGFDLNVAGDQWGSPPTYHWPYRNERRPGHAAESLIPGGGEGEILTLRLAEEAADIIERYADRPFFLYLPFYAVHTPLEADPELVAKYEAKAAALGRPEIAEWGTESGHRWRIIQNHATYAAMVETMDAAVGRVLDALDDNDLADNTIVVFFSDNGGLATSEGWPTTNLPLRAGKGWLYEGGIREPMIVRWSGVVPEGSVDTEPMSSVDFYPTLLEAAAVPVPAGTPVDGISLLPRLRGQQRERGTLYWHYPHYSNQGGRPGGAIREGPYKLIEWYESGDLELYDLANDIGETRNLAEEMPEKAAQLRAKLDGWRREVNAQMPVRNPEYTGAL